VTRRRKTQRTQTTVDQQTVDKTDFEKPKNQNFFNLYLPWSRHAFEQRGTDETEKCVITMAILANRLLRARKRNQGKNKEHYSLVATLLCHPFDN
jgi:transposase